MSWLSRVFHRRALERDLDKELRFHLEAATADYIRRGLSPADADRMARLDLGGLEQTKEVTRDARGTRWIDDFIADVRHALRGMRRTPAISAAAVLTLAVGIGVNTSVWSVVDALMRRSLPVERPDELYVVSRISSGESPGSRADHPSRQVSYALMQQMRRALPDSGALAGMSSIVRLFATISDQPEPVLCQLVSGNYFSLLGVQAQRGRVFGAADTRDVGSAPVAVISEEYWDRRFGNDPSILGRRIRIGDAALVVVGVTRGEFAGLTVGTPVDVFVPLTMQQEVRYHGNASSSNSDTEKPWIPQPGISWITLVTRQPAAASRRATDRLEAPFHSFLVDALAGRDSTERAYGLREHIGLTAIPTGFSPLRDQFGDPLKLLMVSVGLILIITCANLAGLLLARGASRTHELAVRVSLGAQSGRLIRQALTESLTLAVIGGVIGLAVARWCTDGLLTLASTGTRPVPLGASVDATVLLFAVTLTLGAGLLFGIAPALRAGRTDLYDAFKTGGRVGGEGGGSHRLPLGRMLIIGQIALSLLLVTSAVLFVRTFQNLVKINVGYERDRLVTVQLDVRAAGYAYDQLPALHEQLLTALNAVPGVRSASLSLYGIAAGTRRTSGFNPPGRNLPPNDNSGQENFVSPDWFRTVGIELVSGRAFTTQDSKDHQPVVILSQSAARKFLGTDAAVGAHFGYGTNQPWIVVGVVKDARINSLRDTPPPMIYHPLAQGPHEYITSAEVRVQGNPVAVIADVRRALASVNRAIPVRDIESMETLLERGLVRERLVARLAGGFGILALLLTAIGLYGVISYSVARRTNEIGVRLALGATPYRVSWVVLRDSLMTVTIGITIGLLLWFPLLGLTRKLVYGLSPHDPMTLVSGVLLLVAIGALGTLFPAIRAARIDPIQAIRAE